MAKEDETKAPHKLVATLTDAGEALTDLVAFTGFLGGSIEEPGTNTEWRILYLDVELRTWLIVERGNILVWDLVEDKSAPFSQRNVIWVRQDAPVGRGSQPPEAKFLTGDFTRAGDCEAPASGGTLAGATGIFCQARTPSCCGPRSRR
jgi:hypothetical protein